MDLQSAPPTTPPPAPLKKAAEFWRACRFLWPHRRIVLISVCCAVFVGAAFTSGWSTMLPIMSILIDGDTIPNWMNRQIVEKRLDVKVSQEANQLRLTRVDADGALGRTGLSQWDALRSAAGGESTPQFLARLSDPAVSRAEVLGPDDQPRTVHLAPVRPYQAIGRTLAGMVPPQPVRAIATIFAAIVVLASLGNVARFFQEYLSDKAAILTVNDIRRKLYDHVLHIPLEFFTFRGSSDVTSRLVQDAQGLETGFKTVLGQSIQEPIKAGMFFALAVYFDWRLTLFIVLFAPIMVAIIRKFGKKMRRASKKALQNSSVMLGQIDATLAGIRVVKSTSAERLERRRYSRIMTDLVRQQLRMSRIDAFSTPTMETLGLLVFGIVLLFSAWLMFDVSAAYRLDRKVFFAVMGCLAGIAESVRRLGKVNNVLSKASAAASRIFEILEVPVEKPRELSRQGSQHSQTPPLIKLPPLHRGIHFQNVCFTYPGSTATAVDDVDLIVPKGQSVAIVGRNGSGKTTLLALLPRFYDPQKGRVLLDGIDIRTATLHSLRRQISIVTQDSVIFPGTISDNIAYGDPLPDRNRVTDAARRAFAHEFILEKPQGYDTLLGEMGSGLSGGQKQRLCIARAIYRAAPILVLDEATSQVDAESEHLIQQAIDGLMHEHASDDGAPAGPTTFVIAHRFSTILSADTIIVMDRGRIVAQGPHERLLSTCQTYQQLYERQLVTTPA